MTAKATKKKSAKKTSAKKSSANKAPTKKTTTKQASAVKKSATKSAAKQPPAVAGKARVVTATKASTKRASAKKAEGKPVAPVSALPPIAFNAKKSKPAPDIEVGPAELEFIDAIDQYKSDYGRPFPSWSEILYVLRDLGYSKS